MGRNLIKINVLLVLARGNEKGFLEMSESHELAGKRMNDLIPNDMKRITAH